MEEVNSRLRGRVYQLVSQIPEGKVMTYGQIAVLCGHPRATRIVGQIAHFGPTDLPWHRVVNKQGGLANEFSFGGLEGHRKLLQQDGVEIIDDRVDNMDKYLWDPKNSQQ